MKVICISDLHGQESKIDLPEGDLLIIAGDLTVFGDVPTFGRFGMWLRQIAPSYKLGVVVVAGNHDVGLDPDMKPDLYKLNELFLTSIPNVHYLNNSSITINNFKIWGSPITPSFCNWAFNRDRGPDIKVYWDMIPEDVDILVTHGPPRGIRDGGGVLGCLDLAKRIKQLTNLKLHVFGHIHPPHGVSLKGDTLFINASQCSIVGNRYVLTYEPITADLANQSAGNVIQ